jgi:hypothetical protein
VRIIENRLIGSSVHRFIGSSATEQIFDGGAESLAEAFG